ncbi:LysE family translocator [Algicola sagamiensis]|uniref:LysE family translocator n=1 Tax=Algicola sagamiensis TaxID=163869 RepID=UPI000376C558|nr:LysE family translocator [Algicola sagamiensis]
MQEVITFTIIALFLVMSPGPNSILILKTATQHGIKASLLNILGLTSATFVHGALSIFGFSAILMQSATAILWIKAIGAVYLFYIGCKAIWGSFTKQQADVNTAQHVSKPQQPIKSMTEGLLTQLFNPKVSLFYLAAFPQFISFDQNYIADAFLLVFIHSTIIACWFMGIALLLTRAKAQLKQSNGKWIQRLSGSLLIYFGGALLSQKS